MRRVALFALLAISCSKSKATTAFPCATAMLAGGPDGHRVIVSFAIACGATTPSEVKTTVIAGALDCAGGKWVVREGARELIIEGPGGECRKPPSGMCRISLRDPDDLSTSVNGRCTLLD